MNDLFDVDTMLASLLAKQERYLLIRRVYVCRCSEVDRQIIKEILIEELE